MKFIITGDPEDLSRRLPSASEMGRTIEWSVVPVLAFEPVEISMEITSRLESFRPDWMIFMSPRGVSFANQWLLSTPFEVPVTTRIACIGNRTRELAEQEGWEVNFSPDQSGSEGFLEEFVSLLSPSSQVLIPCALNSRELIFESLTQRGNRVLAVPVYRTVPNIRLQEVPQADGAVFTSPSSYEAFRSRWPMVLKKLRLFALGTYTETRMKADGLTSVSLIPKGDLQRIGEVL